MSLCLHLHSCTQTRHHVCVHAVTSDSLQPRGLWPTRLPLPMGFSRPEPQTGGSPGQSPRPGVPQARAPDRGFSRPEPQTGSSPGQSTRPGVLQARAPDRGFSRPEPQTGGSPGQSPRLGCRFLLQGLFPTQGANPHLLRWQADSYRGGPGMPEAACVCGA